MRPYDDSKEFARADELRAGDHVSLQGEWHTVESVTPYEFSSVLIKCTDGYESQTPKTVRLLREVR